MPDWKDAPEWAQWLAQDENGQWYWYKTQPTPLSTDWAIDNVDYQKAYFDNSNWRDTLQHRP